MNIKHAKSYIQTFLKIKTKENKIRPFVLNEPQSRLYEIIAGLHREKKPIRLIILKARQMGFSTLTEALIFHRTATQEVVNSMIVAHKDAATTNLFNMSKLFYEMLPPLVKPMKKAFNGKQIIFENPTPNQAEKAKNPGLRSKIICATAGGAGIGRSDTLTNVHASEYAFWPGDKKATLNGLMQAVPPLPGTMIVIESTANGFDDFKQMWDRAVDGESDFVPVFFAWHEMAEYRMPYSGFELTAEEERIRQAYRLDLEQIAWRRWCIENNCGGDERLFRQEYPACPEEAFLTTGQSIFDVEKVLLRLAEVRKRKPLKRGRFEYDYDGLAITNIRWVEDKEGFIKIYRDAEARVPYVIGGDTAGEGSDKFVGQVLDNRTGEQVCTLRHTFDEDLYARQMYCLGMYYNKALIGIEANYTTYPIRELQRLGYPRQYYRESVDEITRRVKHKYGYVTDRKTRPLILAELTRIVREETELFWDEDTLREMPSFVTNSKGRAEAIAGEHDDCIMAVGIAHGIRGQQRRDLEPLPEEREEDTALEDFISFGY